jgi:hypothetical protein
MDELALLPLPPPPETATQAEAVPVVVYVCGGPDRDPADPYGDVMAGVRFRWADGTLV